MKIKYLSAYRALGSDWLREKFDLEIFWSSFSTNQNHNHEIHDNGKKTDEEAHSCWCQKCTCEPSLAGAQKHGYSDWSWRRRTECEPAGEGCAIDDGARYGCEVKGTKGEQITRLSHNGGSAGCISSHVVLEIRVGEHKHETCHHTKRTDIAFSRGEVLVM